jgi:hypothetical protein
MEKTEISRIYPAFFHKIFGFKSNYCYYKLQYRVLPNNDSAKSGNILYSF